MKLLARQKAQSISEYVVLISLVSLALTGMSLYIKRGVQGVIKDTADIVGDQISGGIERDVRINVISKSASVVVEDAGNAVIPNKRTITFLKGGGVNTTQDQDIGTIRYSPGVLADVITQEKE